jgi:alpha-L-fucosidase
VGDLVDIVSKNGTLLLNIGPRPDGAIPEPEQEILRNIGAWLAVNGEAIYGARPWQVFGEGPTEIVEGHFTDTMRQPFTGQDIRFTTKGNALYAICLDWPGNEAVITTLEANGDIKADTIADISMLGSPASLAWSQDENGLKIQTPSERPCEYAYTFKIVLKYLSSG